MAHYLDCFNQDKSNWLRFVNCARFEEEQNLIAEQYDKKIFFKAYKKILPGDVSKIILPEYKYSEGVEGSYTMGKVSAKRSVKNVK